MNKEEEICSCPGCTTVLTDDNKLTTHPDCCSVNCAILLERSKNGEWGGDWDDPNGRVKWDGR